MKIDSVPTRGRTLDHAAFVYDFFEPILMLGKQAEYNRHIVSLLELKMEDLPFENASFDAVVSSLFFLTFSLCLPPILALCFSLVSAIWPVAIVTRRKAADILRSS